MTSHDADNQWQWPQPCDACNGTGFCARCSGNGRYKVRGQDVWVDCDDCAGSGECPECNGTDRVSQDHWGLDYE